MIDKIVQLKASDTLNHRALLHQVLEREGFEGVVLVARFNGKWETCWGGDVSNANLCMATMKLLHDVLGDVAEDRT